MRIFRFILFAFLPNRVKLYLLKKSGAKIGNNVRIGFSIVSASNIVLGDNVRIGHFNLIWRLNTLSLGNGAIVLFGNWISGAGRGDYLQGANSGVTRFHYFEASGNISIGANSIIAGRSSVFYTHGLSPNSLDLKRSISIGDWCYVGSNTKATPGAKLGHHIFVGMGSVLVKDFSEKSYITVGGVPARKISDIESNCAYFDRNELDQSQHYSN